MCTPLLLLSATACSDKNDGGGNNGGTDTGSSVTSAELDEDEDGFAVDLDCDDTDSAINPDAAEVCDGIDNNCNDLIDDADPAVDLTTGSTWVADSDGDGFGDDATAVDACAAPAAHVADGGDCDDSNETINPAATEVCDLFGTDEDCSGAADDADPNVDPASQSLFYVDGDGDGYGSDTDAGVLLCEAVSGLVLSNTDCDDVDIEVNPGATELCDGIDNDCDSEVTEAGLATFTDSAGTVTDYTGLLTGDASAPAAMSLSTDGELAVCEGTWYVNLDVAANVDIVNPSGTPSDVVLDGANTATVVSVATDGIAVHLEGISIENGYGSGDSFSLSLGFNGGGIDCTATGTTLTATSLDIQYNETALDSGVGGGIGLFGCAASFDDVVIANNVAAFGGGIWVDSGTLDLSNSVVSDNVADLYGGGMMLYDFTDVATVSLDEVDVRDNFAAQYGGGAMMLSDYFGVEMSCVGSTSTTAGFTANSAIYGGGGLFLYGDYSFESDTCDFGTTAGGDDNDPDDFALDFARSSSHDDDETFLCVDGLCGTESTYTIGGATASEGNTTYYTGNIVLADVEASIRSFDINLVQASSSSSCTADFYLMSNTSLSTAGWSVLYASTGVSVPTTAAYVGSGSIGVITMPGTYYAVVMGTTCSSSGVIVNYENGLGSSDAGFGSVSGYMYQNEYENTLTVGDTVEVEYANPYFSIDAQVTIIEP
jgi:hypothetical protein